MASQACATSSGCDSDARGVGRSVNVKLDQFSHPAMQNARARAGRRSGQGLPSSICRPVKSPRHTKRSRQGWRNDRRGAA